MLPGLPRPAPDELAGISDPDALLRSAHALPGRNQLDKAQRGGWRLRRPSRPGSTNAAGRLVEPASGREFACMYRGREARPRSPATKPTRGVARPPQSTYIEEAMAGISRACL
jgi:hypothetical protein